MPGSRECTWLTTDLPYRGPLAMHPSAMAMEGWVWARAASRRVVSGSLSPQSQLAEADCLADLAQGIEAFDRAIRHADHVLNTVSGTALPGGVDWSRLRDFARRGRDALAHGDERLASPGFDYSRGSRVASSSNTAKRWAKSNGGRMSSTSLASATPWRRDAGSASRSIVLLLFEAVATELEGLRVLGQGEHRL